MLSRSERGSALVIALLVSFILSLLGVSFLLMAQTESRIALNERNALQAFYLAEAGSAVVQSWFDRPGTALDFPLPEAVRRSLREVLDESDPYEGAPTAGTQYKEIAATTTDVDLDGDGVVDLFRPPYRGGVGVEHALMGVEDAPDLSIDDADADPAMGTFLDDLSRRILGPAFEASGRRGRISRIDVYAPPYVPVAANWTRYGMATVKVTARIYRLDPDGEEIGVLAERSVKTVLNEIPYGTPVFGPIHACGDLQFSGQLSAHWGAVTAGGVVGDYSDADRNIALSIPRQRPPGPRIDRLWVDLPNEGNCVLEYNARAIGDVADPWLRVVARQSIDDVTSTDYQPYPSTPATYPEGGSCPSGSSDPLNCCDRSNLFQYEDRVLCPEYDYEFWKSIASSGRSDVHYFVPVDDTGQFKEHGMGDAVYTFEQATNGKTGLFFFDTTDSLAPHDSDLDGEFDNLVQPTIVVTGNWQAAGFIYINAKEFHISGPLTPPQNVSIRAPGEPFHDADNNRVYDAGEAWVNLEYPASAGDPFRVDANDDTDDDGGASGIGPVRNTASPYAIALPASFSGILYSSGDVTADGGGVFYGSVIARGKITLGSAGSAPDFFWDDRIRRQWPPLDEVGLPRVVATRWDEEP